jgi:glycosidase
MLARLDESGKRVYFNFTDESAREFVYGVCRFWLDEMGVDGFRFLNSRGFWDGSEGDALAGLCKRLHQLRRREGREIYLFACDCSVLDQEMLNRSALNGVSNSRFQGAIQRMSENRTLEGDFWKTMDLHQLNYSDESMVEKELVQKSALNSCEGTGTHSLIVKMGVLSGQKDLWGNPVGDRKNHWWKVKPYIISQFTATGIPVIYNGQEIGENRYLPEPGPGRYAPRPLNWHYLADFAGKDLFRFHQKLIHLRHKFKAIRSRNFYHYFTDTEHQVLVFKRYQDDEQIVVAVNFGNESCEVLVPFPSDGYWHEYLDDYDVEVLGRQAVVKVPARYGVIFFRE